MLLLLSLLALRQDVPPAIRVEPLQADDRIRLAALESIPSKHVRRIRHLRLDGRSSLPEGAVLKLTVTPVRERLHAGRIEREAAAGDVSLAQAAEGAFIADHVTVGNAVRWEVRVTAPEDYQAPPLREQVKAAVAGREWRFVAFTTNVFQAHPPAEILDAVLLRLEEIRRHVLELAFTVASPSEEVWRGRKEALEAVFRKNQAPRAPILAAAGRAGESIVEVCRSDLRAQIWQGGRVMALQPPGAPPGPLSYEKLLDDVTEAERTAGRELLLLALEDARRGSLGAEHATALAKAREIPGLESLVDRLKPGADLDALEKDLRTPSRR